MNTKRPSPHEQEEEDPLGGCRGSFNARLIILFVVSIIVILIVLF